MALNLSIGYASEQAASRFLLVSGPGRSGTSIFGKLIASCQNVEYKYDPPLLHTLYALLGKIPDEEWKLIHDTYLYEEILLGCLSGRALNTNQADVSSVYNYLPETEVDRRLAATLSRSDCESACMNEKSLITYKLVDIVKYIPKVKELYPHLKVLVMRRKMIPTISSLMRKAWFASSPNGQQSSQGYPFSKYPAQGSTTIHVPYWVESSHAEWWSEASEIERCVYYYLTNTPDDGEHSCIVDYEYLLSNPDDCLGSICEKTGLVYGQKTELLIKSVHPQSSSLKDQEYDYFMKQHDIDSAIKAQPKEILSKLSSASYTVF